MELATGITPRVQEIGRIRMGERNSKNGAPISLKTFRLTSDSRSVLEVAAKLYGGTVARWDGAPNEGMWQLTTAAAELDILIPRALRSVSQNWELWKGGTCERRCKGVTEEISGGPCLCGDNRGEDGYCEIITRVSIILPRLPGLGLWRLDTGGWHAASTIAPTIDLLLALDQRSMVPAVLRAVQASSKVREGEKVITHRFVKPMIDAPGITIGQLVASAESELPALPAGEPVRPRTAEERVAAQRQAIEQRRAAAEQVADPEPVALEAEVVATTPARTMSRNEFETRLAAAGRLLDELTDAEKAAAGIAGVKPKDMTPELWGRLADACKLA